MSANTLRKAGRQSQLPRKKTKSVREKIFAELFMRRERFVGGLSCDNDFSLADLSHGVGLLGAQIAGNETCGQGPQFNLKPVLVKIAAHCIGWIEKSGVKDVFALVHAERLRQENLYKTQPNKYLVIVSSHVADPKRKFRVLVEELGEVANAIDRIERAKVLDLKAAHDALRVELIQLAAVAVAWLETPEVKS